MPHSKSFEMNVDLCRHCSYKRNSPLSFIAFFANSATRTLSPIDEHTGKRPSATHRGGDRSQIASRESLSTNLREIYHERQTFDHHRRFARCYR